jgi:hypothetical protein
MKADELAAAEAPAEAAATCAPPVGTGATDERSLLPCERRNLALLTAAWCAHRRASLQLRGAARAR